MMTHPITWRPPLCRLQTNPDQLNPLMHWALLDSWGKHVDQLKLRWKWHPAYPPQAKIRLWILQTCHFLAVQDSSIGDLVSQSLSESVIF